MYRLKPNQDIVHLILRLKAYEDEYPFTMFVARRETFQSMLFRVLRRWLGR
ncbi:MAG TPA: hypothetical protein VMN99_10135 [Anaerolineales bacterium]|nr:hypothetical protein [Anaerolineales bacterium]